MGYLTGICRYSVNQFPKGERCVPSLERVFTLVTENPKKKKEHWDSPLCWDRYVTWSNATEPVQYWKLGMKIRGKRDQCFLAPSRRPACWKLSEPSRRVTSGEREKRARQQLPNETSPIPYGDTYVRTWCKTDKMEILRLSLLLLRRPNAASADSCCFFFSLLSRTRQEREERVLAVQEYILLTVIFPNSQHAIITGCRAETRSSQQQYAACTILRHRGWIIVLRRQGGFCWSRSLVNTGSSKEGPPSQNRVTYESAQREKRMVESNTSLAAIQGLRSQKTQWALCFASFAGALSAPMFIPKSANPIRRGVGGNLEGR